MTIGVNYCFGGSFEHQIENTFLPVVLSTFNLPPQKIIPLEIVSRAATLLLGSAGFSAGAISPALIYIICISSGI